MQDLPPSLLRLLADLVLYTHAAFVAFVVGGQVAIMAGCSARRAFARNRRFRWMHLGAIAFVVAESWLGILCPLTEWESALRLRAGDAPYTRGFIADRVAALVYYDLPGWVFTTAYTTFGALVLLTWWRCPPAKHTSDRDRPGGRHVVE